MKNTLTLATLATIPLVLGACSKASPTNENTTAATTASEKAAVTDRAKFPFGGKVDSLNGIAGHTFGQPLSAFPKLKPISPNSKELIRAYEYAGKASGWFGKHQADVRIQLYYFQDGKFAWFRAIGDPTVLRPEALYLLGPGSTEGQYRIFWEGSRARAAYTEEARGFGREGTLNVISKTLEEEKAAQEQAKLKAENAQ